MATCQHPDHDEDPPLALPGLLLCASHRGRLTADIDTIRTRRAELDLRPATGAALISGGRGRADHGSPVNLAALVAADRRSARSARAGVDNVDATLIATARMITEERGWSAPLTRIGDAIRVIAASAEWIAAHPAADEWAAELRGCAWTLRVLAGDTPEPRIGSCPELLGETQCGGPLRLQPNGDVACGRCRSIGWTAADVRGLARVAPLDVLMSVPEVALVLGVPERTVRHWVATGRVRRSSLGLVSHGDVWRHARRGTGA